MLEPPDFQGISGLDLTLRKSRYVRRNRTPVFIEERSPAPNREGLWELLAEQGMEHLNRLEWLIRADYRYAGDKLYVVRAEEVDAARVVDEALVIGESQNSWLAMRALLQALARGDRLKLRDGSQPGKDARKTLHDTLVMLLEKGEEYRQSQRGSDDAGTPGRRRIAVEDTRFDEALRNMASGKITADEAAKRLGISRATFFRRKREWEDGRQQQEVR